MNPQTLSKTCLTNGIAEQTMNHASFLHAFPNPSSSQLTLDIYQENCSEIKVEICDVMGRNVLEKTIANFHLNAIEQVDISNITDGIYYVKVNGGTATMTQKIIIAR